jgi:hypothetical protein
MLPRGEAQLVVTAAEASKLTLSQFTIPFYTKQNGRVFVAGSGVLIVIGDKHFAVTTAHMFDACELARLALCVPSGAEGTTLLPFDKVEYHRPATKDPFHRKDEPFDFCVCELPADMVGPLCQCKKFLRLNQIDPFDKPHPYAWYTVLGYPGALNPTDMANRRLKADAMICCSRPYCGERGEVKNYNPKIHLQMAFAEELCTDGDGEPIPLPHPGGMSGCGMWRLVKAETGRGCWTMDDVQLVAIQQSLHGGVIRGTLIKFPLDLIWRLHERLHAIFDMHYGDKWRECLEDTQLAGGH